MRRWRPDEEVLDAAVSTTARLTYALDRLIAVQTLETARTVICQCAAELANADQVLLFELEDENRPGSLELTSTIGDECGARDAQTAARLLSVEAASSGLAHSTLDRFDEPDLDRLAISWHAAGRLCLSYPLRQRESCVGSLTIVCLSRPSLLDEERWALRRFYQPAAAALVDEQARAKLRALVHHDPLTGVLNRRGLDEAFEQLPAGGGLLLVDFDDLKRLNESVGYDAGDEVLKAIGLTLRAAAAERELVARLGGDEFVLLVPKASRSELQLRAEQLAEMLDTMPVPASAQPHYRGASVGATQSKPGESPQLLIRRATVQMRRKKQRRKTDS